MTAGPAAPPSSVCYRVIVDSYAAHLDGRTYRETCCEIELEGLVVHTLRGDSFEETTTRAMQWCLQRASSAVLWLSKRVSWKYENGERVDVVRLREIPAPAHLAT